MCKADKKKLTIFVKEIGLSDVPCDRPVYTSDGDDR